MIYNPANTQTHMRACTHTHTRTRTYLRLGERGKRKKKTRLFGVVALEEWDKE